MVWLWYYFFLPTCFIVIIQKYLMEKSEILNSFVTKQYVVGTIVEKNKRKKTIVCSKFVSSQSACLVSMV